MKDNRKIIANIKGKGKQNRTGLEMKDNGKRLEKIREKGEQNRMTLEMKDNSKRIRKDTKIRRTEEKGL